MLNRVISIVLRPLCWIGLHSLTSRTANERIRCDVCGKFLKR